MISSMSLATYAPLGPCASTAWALPGRGPRWPAPAIRTSRAAARRRRSPMALSHCRRPRKPADRADSAGRFGETTNSGNSSAFAIDNSPDGFRRRWAAITALMSQGRCLPRMITAHITVQSLRLRSGQPGDGQPRQRGICPGPGVSPSAIRPAGGKADATMGHAGTLDAHRHSARGLQWIGLFKLVHSQPGPRSPPPRGQDRTVILLAPAGGHRS